MSNGWRELQSPGLKRLNDDSFKKVRAEQRILFDWLFRVQCAPSLKIIAITIAKRPCTPQGWTTTSARQIGREAGVSDRTSRLAIRRLEEAGILSKRFALRLGRGKGPSDRIELRLTREGIGERSEAILAAPFPKAGSKTRTYGLDDLKGGGYLDFLKDI